MWPGHAILLIIRSQERKNRIVSHVPTFTTAYIRLVFWFVQWMPAFILIGHNGSFGSGYLILNWKKSLNSFTRCRIKSPLIHTIDPLHKRRPNLNNKTHTSLASHSRENSFVLKHECEAKDVWVLLFKFRRHLCKGSIGLVFLHCHLYCNSQNCT